MTKLMAGVFALALLAWAAPARADYVCSTHINPASISGNGDGGSIYATFYSGPSCTGTFSSASTFCSTNATSSGCATAANCGGNGFLFTGAQLNQLVGMLQQAQATGQRVTNSYCTTSAGAFVYFYSN